MTSSTYGHAVTMPVDGAGRLSDTHLSGGQVTAPAC